VHGVKLSRIENDVRVKADVSLLSNPQYAPASFEGRIAIAAFAHRRESREMPVRAGSWLVPMDQPLANVALHILEPMRPIPPCAGAISTASSSSANTPTPASPSNSRAT
jgi:hypothetical protein